MVHWGPTQLKVGFESERETGLLKCRKRAVVGEGGGRRAVQIFASRAKWGRNDRWGGAQRD